MESWDDAVEPGGMWMAPADSANRRQQCIALLGRSSVPLYLRAVGATAGDASEMKWYFLAHSALDVMEDRGA